MEPLDPPNDPPEGTQRDTKLASTGSRDVEVPSGPKRDAKRAAEEPRDVRVPPEATAARLGAVQAGAVTWAQLRERGVGARAIRNRALNGQLHRKHRGVYIVGHTALAPTANERAALLACGEDAVISHWSAAYLWGLIKASPDQVHVTVVGGRRRPRAGVVIRTTTRLTRQDIRSRRGLRLTSPARTIIDLAADADLRTLERLIAEARVLELLRDGELQKALARAGRRPGVARMRAFLEREGGPVLTRSEAERRMRRLARAAGFPMPIANTRVAGWEVDFYWPEQRLVVEVDGFDFHRHKAAFVRDRKKGLALTAAGNRVIRIAGVQLAHEPLWLAVQLAGALAGGAPEWVMTLD